MPTLNTDPVNPAEAKRLILPLVELKKSPFFLHGKPGIGKSEIVAQIAKQLGMELKVVMLTQIDSQDLRGIQYPDPVKGRMVYFPPEFLPDASSPPTLLFLDELTGAEQRLQVSAYQLLLSRQIGDYHLPAHSYVCAAGNGPDDGAIAFEMGTALASRMLHISVQAEPRSWINWALDHGVHASVITLIQIKGELLEQTKEQIDGDRLIGPNPRAWAAVSDILHHVGVANRELAEPLVSGLVGRSAAAELFLTAEEMKDLPLPEKILEMSDAEFAQISPKTIPCLYGLTYSLAAFATTAPHMIKALNFLSMMVDQTKNQDLPAADCFSLGAELIMSKAIRSGKDMELISSPDFQKHYARVKEVSNVAAPGQKPKSKAKK
jgi:MoxR-like ATPase